MKTIYLECNMGAAGDMLMSALYEICGQKDWFLYKMNEIFAPYGVTLTASPATKCGIRGTQIHVSIHGREEDSSPAHMHSEQISHAHVHHHEPESASRQEQNPEFHREQEHTHTYEHSHHHADYASILAQIQSLPLADEVKTDAASIYQLLGNAEAHVHGTALEQIHFHEVGTLDAIADVVGCALLIHLIAPEQILASPIHVGNGFVRCAHGILPVPAPATAELLKGIPYYSGSVTGELCTPTGAAILKYYVTRFFPMPTLTTTSIGYGMGKKDFEIANCIRAFLGNTDSYLDDAEDDFSYDDIILSISCNIDDMTGEALGLATEILMTAGALDVYTIPIQMKKNRPGILLTCICELEDREKFTGLFFLHTSTRGVRYQTFERAKLDSTFETRSTSYGDIRIKRSSGYGIHKEKPEFEDLKSVVFKNGCSMSLDEVAKSLH